MKTGLIGLIAAGVFGAAALASLGGEDAASTAVVLPAAQTVNASGRVDSLQAGETYLTIYPDDLAMVTEVRRVTLPEGPVTLRILGVSDQIISQTAVLQSFEGISLERNFDADLITKGALLNRAVGSEITIRRINPASGEITRLPAKLVSASRMPNNSNIQGAVFETEDGIHALECAGLYETVLFGNLPDRLNPAPVLSMDVRSESAGEKEIAISYLTQGIGWEADYRLDVNGDNTEGALKGWLTLTNSTSKSFENVPTAIIAGEVNRDRNTQAEYVRPTYFQPTCWPKGSTKTGVFAAYVYENVDPSRPSSSYESVPMMMRVAQEAMSDEIVVTGTRRQATREDLGDYKLYRTPQPVTVAAHQTKQIAFLSVPDAEIEQLYKFDIYAQHYNDTPISADIEYEIDNSKEGRLAQPLPRGTVRVMMTRPNGQTAFLGEDNVRDLAVDLPVEVNVSESINVKMRPEITGVNDPDEPYLRISADIFNAMPEAVTAEIEIYDDRIRAQQISRESHPRDSDETVPTYRIAVPPLEQEVFYIDIPVDRIFTFERSTSLYDGKKTSGRIVSMRTKEKSGPIYALRGQSYSNSWPTRFFKAPSNLPTDITLSAKLLSREDFKTVLGTKAVKYRERFTFTNPSGEARTVRFTYTKGDHFVLKSSTIAPQNPDDLVWMIDVPANGTQVLTLTIEADYIP